MSSDMIFRAIAGFRLVTAHPERLAAFYRGDRFRRRRGSADSRRRDGAARPCRRRFADRDVAWSKPRRSRILRPSGSPLSRRDATACDLVFQHLALVTDDAETAWRRACDAGATPISREGPVTLPQSAGGVTAVKFRDPEGHPLEFLQFPRGANPDWKGKGIMGIDHSAISVSDVAASRRFYARHGLSEGSCDGQSRPDAGRARWARWR